MAWTLRPVAQADHYRAQGAWLDRTLADDARGWAERVGGRPIWLGTDTPMTYATVLADAEAFAQQALKLPFVERIVLRVKSAADLPASHPAQEKLRAVSGNAAFVCVGERCSLPVTEPEQIAPAVAAMRG